MADQPKAVVGEGSLTNPVHRFSIGIDASTVVIAFLQPEVLLTEAGTLETLRSVPSTAVAMSPVLAKDLAKVLSRVLKDYETNVGPIPEMVAVKK